MSSSKVAVLRRVTFNAAHRLHNPKWSAEKNRDIFGKCNNPNYHGHNYALVVKVIGEIDPETGFVIDLKILKEIMNEHIHKKFDHKNLNLDLEEFKNLNPTAENIGIVIWNILREQIDKKFDIKIELSETEKNKIEYPVS
jgi:6-pyruvoyltetrahydropterin/6-carboxytetrahydropterin synthase